VSGSLTRLEMRKLNWPQSATGSGGVISAEAQPIASLPVRSGAELVSAATVILAARVNITRDD
jgi:hypothetical protein